jgi:quercetin dioxygenase-like cupin family protein
MVMESSLDRRGFLQRSNGEAAMVHHYLQTRRREPTMSRSGLILSAFASILLAGHPSFAAEASGKATIVQAEALKWAPAQGLPPGAQVAVLYGDPSKPGPFAMRLKFPTGYEIPTHSHPTDEFITVLSGKGRMAFGEDASAAKAEPLPAGAFMSVPAGAWHHLSTDTETILELHSTGPFEFKLHHG